MNGIEELYKKTRKKHIKNIKKIFNHDYNKAEDIIQEAYCKAIEYFSSYDPKRGKLESWFTRILYNVVVDELRKEKKLNLLNYHLRWKKDNIDQIELIENLWFIKQEINKIKSSKAKKILSLVYFYGYSMKEIAIMFKVTEMSVKQLCYRFRQFVKEDYNDSILD